MPLQALAAINLEGGAAYLTLLNPTGGLLGGDRLLTQVYQSPETHVFLTTPSSARVYRAAKDSAMVETAIRLGEGATLEYLPDHVIPHAGAALRQYLRVEMAPGSRAILTDGFAAGRIACGEAWSFARIDSRIDIFCNGDPVYVNRSLIEPARRRPQRVGEMQRFEYAGSLVALADAFSGWDGVARAMNGVLAGFGGVLGGVSLLARGGCVARFLARSAFELTQATVDLWRVARELVMQLPSFDLRKY